MSKAKILGVGALCVISAVAGMQYGQANAKHPTPYDGPTRIMMIERFDDDYEATVYGSAAKPGQCEQELPVRLNEDANNAEEANALFYACLPVDLNNDDMVSFEIFPGN